MAIANAPDFLQCEPFSYNTVTQPTNIWCSPGDAGLWQTCTDSHKGMKSTMQHIYILQGISY